MTEPLAHAPTAPMSARRAPGTGEETNARFDVAVVGASIAGCTAATLFARAGLSVALLERHGDPAAYKTACTHLIQSNALPVIRRLGLDELIEQAGGVPSRISVWTRWGWIVPPPDDRHPPHNYNLRRAKLDPILRELASSTPGVELMPGHTGVELARSDGQVTGVEVRDRAGMRTSIDAKLVVGADGRGSKVADLAGLSGKAKKNGRFAYYAYYRGLDLAEPDRSLIWFLDPDMAYMFPNDEGVTLVAAFPTRDKLSAFKADPQGSFERFFAELPEAPSIAGGERVSKLLAQIDMPSISRPAAGGGVALVGDAALSSDPAEGVGCGWAFRSAEWLVDHTSEALRGEGDLERGLRRYRRRHRSELRGHHFFICDYATGRKLNPAERLLYAAATRDPEVARRVYAFAMRNIKPRQFMTPGTIARAVATRFRERPVSAP